ncbi:MAG TPA: inositol monophosphatase family protein [Solirubrobacteraceae bacterium]|nr:inositol monophosphatase family protein [Solirubrobacteraceae bacterium]
MSEAQLAELAQEAAVAAGALLRERFVAGRESSVANKSSPTDPVSEADLASQRAIRSLIAERRPDDAFLAEEGADVEGSSGLRWVVDPLDGTVNFLYGIARWSVSVAVRDAHGTLAGVVHNPMMGETFTATRGGPALLGGEPIRSRAADAPALARSLVATGFGYDAALRARQGAVLARLLPMVRDIRRPGSAALDLCDAALGRCDAYYEHGLSAWDVTAGALICRCAGLEVRELAGGILAAPPALAGELAEIVDAVGR